MLSRGPAWVQLLCHHLRCVCSIPRLIQSDVDGRSRGVSYHAETDAEEHNKQESGRHDLGYDGWPYVRREKKIRVGLGVRRGEVGPVSFGMKAISRLAKRENPRTFLGSGCGISNSHNSIVHVMEMVQTLEVHKMINSRRCSERNAPNQPSLMATPDRPLLSSRI